jgi:hypothetical protein
MIMLELLKQRIWGEELGCDDPIFGHLTNRRISRRGQPIGDLSRSEWFGAPIFEPGLRFSKIEQIIIHAGYIGPIEEHLRV